MAPAAYDSLTCEKKWRDRWEADRLFAVDLDHAKRPFYNLIMFPYPSSASLHVGHVYCYGGADTYGRYLRLQGYDVFEPMGFDAFGIHAENFALKIGEHPQVVVPRNIAHFRDNQMKRLGAMFDWAQQVDTTDPSYYKWTQWVFLQMQRAGLVERKREAVDYCPSCKTVLANEQVIDGLCERCSTQVEQKTLEQWFFKITAYAEPLLAGLQTIDWPERTKALQRNWIGKKTGIDIRYRIEGREDLTVTCFTTRPETNFGATFVVLAPELALVDEIVSAEQRPAVEAYRATVRLKNELERTELAKEKTGVFTGAYCINDLSGERLPIWVGDFVLAHFGTGAVVGVPAHDIRDFEFAKMAGIPIRRVLTRDGDTSEITTAEQVWEDDGTLMNSDFLDGMDWRAGREAVMDHIEKMGWGQRTVSYRLHDWLISRQRYWGPPIPMIHCESCATKDRATKVLLLHGTSGSGQGNWFPWLRETLEAAGIEVKSPTFPDASAPDYDGRMAFLEGELAGWIDANTVVIGHSAGAAAALHLAERHQLRKLILVAPYLSIPENQRESFLSAFGAETAEASMRYLSRGYDQGKIVRNVAQIVSLFGGQDPYANADLQNQVRDLFPDAPMRILPNAVHFTKEDMATRAFPEILSELPPLGAGAGWRPVPEEQLPVVLPPLDNYEPDGSGRGPLAGVADFVQTTCPDCGGPARRETDVSDTFLDSAWYQLRYPSAEFTDKPFDAERTAKWLPVDMYIGGIEHATMHLLYFRFVSMVLNDLGYLPFREPAKRLRHQGLIIKDGAKMSKSRGNVVNPDEYIQKYGADAFRTYMLFIGPYEEGGEFNDKGILGVTRFLDKVWGLLTVPRHPERAQPEAGDEESRGVEPDEISPASAVRNDDSVVTMGKLHATIKKVTEDMEVFQFNTSIAALMELSNWVRENIESFSAPQWEEIKRTFPILLAPFAPHFAEELWEALGYPYSVHNQTWPTYDEAELVVTSVEIVIQVNGKIRSRFSADPAIGEAQAKEIALADDRIKPWLMGKAIRKVIYVPGKLVNVVV